MSHKSLDSKFVCVSLARVSFTAPSLHQHLHVCPPVRQSLYLHPRARVCVWVLAAGHGARVPGGALNPHLPWTCQPRSTSAGGSTGSGCVWPCWSGSSCRGGRCTPCSSECCDGRNPTTHIQKRKKVSWRLDQTWWFRNKLWECCLKIGDSKLYKNKQRSSEFNQVQCFWKIAAKCTTVTGK